MLAYQLEEYNTRCGDCRRYRPIQWQLETDNQPVCNDCWRIKYKGIVESVIPKKKEQKVIQITRKSRRVATRINLDHAEDKIHIYNCIRESNEPMKASQILEKLKHLKLRRGIYANLRSLEQEGKIVSCRKHTRMFTTTERADELKKYSLKRYKEDKREKVINSLRAASEPISIKIIQEETGFSRYCINNILKCLIHEDLAVYRINREIDQIAWYALVENEEAIAILNSPLTTEQQIINLLKNEGRMYLSQINAALGKNPRSTTRITKILDSMVKEKIIYPIKEYRLYYSLCP